MSPKRENMSETGLVRMNTVGDLLTVVSPPGTVIVLTPPGTVTVLTPPGRVTVLTPPATVVVIVE